MTFSDGMCRECAAKARAEWQLPPSTRPAPAPRFDRAFRPDFAFAAAVLLLGLAATFGVVVGPPRPVQQQTARVEIAPPITGQTAVDRAAENRAPSGGAERLPTDRAVVDRTPAERAPAPQAPTIVAETPSVSHHAPARAIRVVRASAKRPVLAAYQPFERPTPIEVVRAPETPAAKPVVVAAAWRVWPEGAFFQAP